jgi:hypothetical protein
VAPKRNPSLGAVQSLAKRERECKRACGIRAGLRSLSSKRPETTMSVMTHGTDLLAGVQYCYRWAAYGLLTAAVTFPNASTSPAVTCFRLSRSRPPSSESGAAMPHPATYHYRALHEVRTDPRPSSGHRAGYTSLRLRRRSLDKLQS